MLVKAINCCVIPKSPVLLDFESLLTYNLSSWLIACVVTCSLGTRPLKKRKRGSGKRDGVKVYTAEC